MYISYQTYFLDLAKEMKKDEWDPVYWSVVPNIEKKVKIEYPKAICHNHYDAIKGIPPKEYVNKELEPLCPLLLEKMAGYERNALRMFERNDSHTNTFTYREREDLYRYLVQYWSTIIRDLNPQHVVFEEEPHQASDYVLYAVCHLMGVDTIMFIRTKFHERMYPIHRFEEGSVAIREAYQKKLIGKMVDNVELSASMEKYFSDLQGSYENAISLSPSYAVAHYNLGNLMKDRGDLDCAVKLYEKAISLNPHHAASFNNMGHALRELGKIDGSLENYIKAIELQPKFVEAHSNLAATWKEKGKLDEAIASAKRAISIQPDFVEAHMNLSFALLNKGMLREGLDEYEWRWKTIDGQKRLRSFVRPWWNGKTSLDSKTILIWSEQGVGDTLNWSSRLSCVSDIAANCILQCPEKLGPLLSRSFPNIKIEPVDQDYGLSRTDIDFHLPMGSIYRIFPPEDANDDLRNTLLVPDPDRVAFWKERLGSIGAGPYIGLAWKSSNLAQRRMMNYASISDLAPVLQLPNATFVNLQYKDFSEDLREVKNKNGITIHNFDDLDHFNNIDDVAALCAALDIVVTTKNTVSIIASRVGTATKLANWRQSPWNNPLFNPTGPSVEIFERNTWESWERVFCEIANDITSSSYMKYTNGVHVDE